MRRLLALLVVPLLPIVLEAQNPVPTLTPRVLRGRVLSETNREPLIGAEVVLMDLGRLVRTGTTGSFSIEVPAEPYRLQVRRIGYLSKAFRFRTRADTMEVEFLLKPSAVVLDSLTVTGKQGFASGRLQDFDRRRKVSATGQFLGPDELALHRDQRMGEALRHLRGIRIAPLGSYGQSAISMRGNSGFNPNSVDCHMAVWVDGQLLSQPGRPFDLDMYTVDRIAGVEVYTGPAETPIEFEVAGNSCGAIVMWTRER